jgi:translocation and assembly module TamB
MRQTNPPPPAKPWPIALDVTLIAPDQVFLRGRGITAELAGRVHLGGTAADPKPQGGFTLRSGRVSLAGQTLNFTAGRVSLDGRLPIDPTIDFTAVAQGSSVIATLEVTGTASRPRIALSSVPTLPQDEVLAQLLFHQSAASLGPLQIAQIATGLAQLTDLGGAGAFDPIGSVRERLGLDTLSVGSTALEAGRSIARGVTIGARQSVSGTGTQATVRLDLARGLRLEADVGVAPPVPSTVTQGAAPTGNQVALTYEFEY